MSFRCYSMVFAWDHSPKKERENNTTKMNKKIPWFHTFQLLFRNKDCFLDANRIPKYCRLWVSKVNRLKAKKSQSEKKTETSGEHEEKNHWQKGKYIANISIKLQGK